MNLFTLMWKQLFLLFLMISVVSAGCKQSCKNKGYRSATNKFCEQIQVDNCLVRKSIERDILIVESLTTPKEIFNNSYLQINTNYENLCPGYFTYEFTPECVKIEPIVISSSSKLTPFVYFFYYFVFTNLL